MNKSYQKIIGKLPCIALFLTITTLTSVNAQLKDVETPRLMSLSGAGVGSVLLNEAALLNPASAYFFQKSSIHYQQNSTSYEDSGEDGIDRALIVTDTSSQLRGSFSYQLQEFEAMERERITSSAAASLGKKTSFGVLYRYTHERISKYDTYHQFNFGITHIYNDDITLGVVLNDPFLSKKGQSRAIVGFQYDMFESLSLIADYGADYNSKPEDRNFWRAGLQAKFFQDFLLRYGMFDDNISQTHGSSWGISWLGPKIAFDYAMRNSFFHDDNILYGSDEQIKEHSFAITVVF